MVKVYFLMVVSHFVSHMCCVINLIGLFPIEGCLVVLLAHLDRVFDPHSPNSLFIPIAVTLHGLINMPLLHL